MIFSFSAGVLAQSPIDSSKPSKFRALALMIAETRNVCLGYDDGSGNGSQLEQKCVERTVEASKGVLQAVIPPNLSPAILDSVDNILKKCELYQLVNLGSVETPPFPAGYSNSCVTDQTTIAIKALFKIRSAI
jgi:hypothetical protein